MNGHQDSTGDLIAALGLEIQFWRRRRGMTREELAAAANTSKSTIARSEQTGPVEIATTARIADALGVELVQLITYAQDSLREAATPLTRKVHGELLEKAMQQSGHGYRTIARAVNVAPDVVLDWIKGEAIPDARERAVLRAVLGAYDEVGRDEPDESGQGVVG